MIEILTAMVVLIMVRELLYLGTRWFTARERVRMAALEARHREAREARKAARCARHPTNVTCSHCWIERAHLFTFKNVGGRLVKIKAPEDGDQ